MKRFLFLAFIFVLVVCIVPSSFADKALMYNDVRADPSANVDDPYDLDSSNYSASFGFKNYSATMAIIA